MPYTYKRETDGTDETFDIRTPEGDLLASVHFWDDAAFAEAKARQIVTALNAQALTQKLLEALTLIGNACRVQANLNSTATREERSRFISSVFAAWNGIIAPMMEEGVLGFEDNALTVNEKQLANG